MEPSNPWLRFFAGIVCAAIAIRVAIDVIQPVLGYVIGAFALVGIALLARWWRANRW